MCMPRLLTPDTYIAELSPDPAFTQQIVPVRNVDTTTGCDVIAPPPPEDPDRPIYPDETRVLAFGLGRSTELEQKQVETNKVASSLLRCNTSMQPLITPTQAKAAMFYSSKYCSKDPFELSSALSFFHQAQIAMRKYGSTASDAGSASRNAKCILQKVINKIGHIEVSAQQAADSLLGNDSFFASHKFRFIFIWDVIQRIRSVRASERRLSEDDPGTNYDEHSDNALDSSERQSETIVLDSEGRVTALTQFDQYVNRGRHLKDLSLYDYVACVKMIRVHKREQTTIEIGAEDGILVPPRGRPRRGTYSFESGDWLE